MVTIERYAVFAYEIHRPLGGIDDLKRFASEPPSEEALKEIAIKEFRRFDEGYISVYDLKAKEEVFLFRFELGNHSELVEWDNLLEDE